MSIFRFQNFCFLAIAALMGTMLFCDMCHTQVVLLSEPSQIEEVAIKFNESFAFIVLSASVLLSSIAGICGCAKPTFQLRCAVVSLTILLAFQIWIAVLFFRMKNQYIFSIAALYPLVSMILDMLAIKFALKDITQDAAHDLYHNLRKARMIKPQKIKK